MLEIRDLTKVYKTKGGAETRALDGVSLTFGERGMVFLLGKSGSGKSTLLNLCGGLDTPDSGEIIIKGRSSRDFSQADFDSYRNTFVGFVFQEYNILNEFTVEDNIALALELQGKNKDKARVREILEQVEMSSFAKRKPNTLSGGQKQRIAIARALVKNPEIIMADEPTGALDSNTGKQVFDTLKKLSQDKLVIVVSHDREFAEIYGDRIIELKDGRIISDVTKTKIAATAASENLTFIGEDTLSVKNGAELSAADMERIRRFLANSKGSVLLSNGEKEIADFKKAARIDENGAREAFRGTDEAAIESKTYKPEDSRFIRSKLPARHAVRIGASGMKAKPFRLFFTIFLSFIAFTMFGLFSTLTFYDEKSVTLETYLDSGYEYIQLANNYRHDSVYYENGKEVSRYSYTTETRFTPAQLQQYRERYGDVVGLYNFGSDFYSGSFRIANAPGGGNTDGNSAYYSPEINFFAEVNGQTEAFTLLTDTDLSQLGDDGIVISSYMFDTLKALKLTDANGTPLTLNGYSDIVGAPLLVNGSVQLTVKGVYELNLPAKYDTIRDGTEPRDSSLYEGLENELNAGMYCTVLVSEDFYTAQRGTLGQNNNESFFTYLTTSLQIADADYAEGGARKLDGRFSEIAPFSENNAAALPYLYMFDEGKTELADGEIVVPVSFLWNILWNFQSQLSSICYDDYIEKNEYKLEEYAAEVFDMMLDNVIFDQFNAEYYQLVEQYLQKVYDDTYAAAYDKYYTEHFEEYYLTQYQNYYPDRYDEYYNEYNNEYLQDHPDMYEEAAAYATKNANADALAEEDDTCIQLAEQEIVNMAANEAESARGQSQAEAEQYAKESLTEQATPIAQERALLEAQNRLNNEANEAASAAQGQFNEKYNNEDWSRYEWILQYGYYDLNGVMQYPTADEVTEAFEFFRSIIREYGDRYDFSIPKAILLDESSSAEYETQFTVVGFLYASQRYTNCAMFSQSDYEDLLERFGDQYEEPNQGNSYWVNETKYAEPEDAKYNLLAMRFPDRGTLSAVVYGSKAENTEDDSFYSLYSGITVSLERVNMMIGTFEQIFLWVGLVMALFSMLLLFNFISVSITYKKKEIGILRAVGARSADVFKIFFSESAIIAAICFVLAMVASFVTCGILNNTVAGALGAAIFVFGPLSWLIMLGIAVVTSVIATFLPVYGIAKRRPVESIRAL